MPEKKEVLKKETKRIRTYQRDIRSQLKRSPIAKAGTVWEIR